MVNLSPGDSEKKVVGCLEHWGDVLRVWAAFCFHHHQRCERHPDKCRMTVCPLHPGPASAADFPFEVDDDSKDEPVEVAVKREGSVAAKIPGGPRRWTPGQAYGQRYTRRAGDSDSEHESDRDSDGMPLSGPPLYDPDTPPGRSTATRSPLPAPPPQSPSATSASVSSASSLSASSRSTAGPSAAAGSSVVKGESRAGEIPSVAAASSISQHRRVAVAPAASTISMDGAFYVGENGSLNLSTAGAFKAVQEGGVQVVYGFEAAAALAREMAAKRKREVEEEDEMDVVASSLM